MHRAFTNSTARTFSRVQRNVISIKSNQTRRRTIQETKRNISSTARLAVANELSSLRLSGAISGFEDSIIRGWDILGDDDGG
jgi:hypothetical protein